MFTLNGQTVSRAPGSTRFDGTIVGMSNEQLYRLDEIRRGFVPGTMRENALAPEDGGGYIRTGKEALSSSGDVMIDAFGTVHGAGGPQMVGAFQAERAREQMFRDAMKGRSLAGINVSSAALSMKQALDAEMSGSKSFFTTTARMSDADYNKALTRSQQFIQNYVSKNYGSEEETPAAPTIPETVIQAQEQAGGPQPSGGGDSGDGGGGGTGYAPGTGDTGGSYTAYEPGGESDYSGNSSFDATRDEIGLASGGRIGMQTGGAAQRPLPEAGFVAGPPENFTERETIADDQNGSVAEGTFVENFTERETIADDQNGSVAEGTFVINAAAVEYAGSDDIRKMILDAYSKAREKGLDIGRVDRKLYEGTVDVALSKGEVVVPPELAKIIGYDRLEKINNRGKKEVSRRQEAAGGGFLDGKKFAEGGEVDYEDRIIADEVRRKMQRMLGNLSDDVTVTSEYYEDQPVAKMAGKLYRGKTVSDYQKALADAAGMVPITGRFKANPRTQEINVPQTPTLFNLFAMAEEIAHLDHLDKRRTNPYPDPEALGSFFNPSAEMNKKYSQYDRKAGAKEPFNPYEAFEMEERYNEEMRAKAIAYETVRGMLPKSKKTADFTKLGYQEGFARYVYDNAPPVIRAGLFKKYPELQKFVDDKGRFVSKKTPIINEGVREYNRRSREEDARRNMNEGGEVIKTLPERKPRRGELADVELRADLEEFIKDDQLARLGWDLYTSRDIKLVGLPISRGAKYGYSASGVYLPAEGRDTYPVFPSGLGYSEEQESQREKVGGAASLQGTFMEPMFEGVGKVLDPKAPTVTYFAESAEIPKRDRATAATRNDRAQVMITLAHELRHAALNHMKFEYGAPEMTLGGEESLMDYFDEKARRTASKKNALVSAIPLTKGREKRYKAARLSSYNKDMYEMYNELATEILKERGVPTIAPPEEKGFITKFMDKLFREPHPSTGTLKKGDGKPVDYESEAMQSANF
jgi:hypothetical protein